MDEIDFESNSPKKFKLMEQKLCEKPSEDDLAEEEFATIRPSKLILLELTIQKLKDEFKTFSLLNRSLS